MNSRLGNRTDAQYAYRLGKRFVGSWESPPKRLSNGWYLKGVGTYRVAFLSPDKVVYKVDYCSSDDGDNNVKDDFSCSKVKCKGHVNSAYGNQKEWKMYPKIKSKLPDGFALPAMQPYMFKGEMVLACEYIKGRFDLSFDDYYRSRNIGNCLGLDDLHSGNVKTSKGIKYILDFTS